MHGPTAMVNGYSGYVPASYKQLRSDIARFPNDEVLRLSANTRWMGAPVQLYELLAP